MLSFSRDQIVGLNGELWVGEELIKRGYEVKVPGDFDRRGCDLFANGLCLEIKFAYPTTRWVKRKNKRVERVRWQFWMHPSTLAMEGDWAAVLVAEDVAGERYPYIIPYGAIGDRNHLQITSHPLEYSGWMRHYLDRWDVIDYLAEKRYRLFPDFRSWPGVVRNGSRNKTSVRVVGSLGGDA